MQEQEVTTENIDGMIDYWSDSSSERRLAASASGTIKGDYELYRWKNKHTLNGQPIAGIVLAWTPSNNLTIDDKKISDIGGKNIFCKEFAHVSITHRECFSTI